MADWAETLVISGGTTSTGLTAGAQATGADYGVISVWSGAGLSRGVLNNFSVLSGGTIVNSYCHAWSCGPAWFLRKYGPDCFSAEQML